MIWTHGPARFADVFKFADCGGCSDASHEGKCSGCSGCSGCRRRHACVRSPFSSSATPGLCFDPSRVIFSFGAAGGSESWRGHLIIHTDSDGRGRAVAGGAADHSDFHRASPVRCHLPLQPTERALNHWLVLQVLSSSAIAWFDPPFRCRIDRNSRPTPCLPTSDSNRSATDATWVVTAIEVPLTPLGL